MAQKDGISAILQAIQSLPVTHFHRSNTDLQVHKDNPILYAALKVQSHVKSTTRQST